MIASCIGDGPESVRRPTANLRRCPPAKVFDARLAARGCRHPTACGRAGPIVSGAITIEPPTSCAQPSPTDHVRAIVGVGSVPRAWHEGRGVRAREGRLDARASMKHGTRLHRLSRRQSVPGANASRTSAIVRLPPPGASSTSVRRSASGGLLLVEAHRHHTQCVSRARFGMLPASRLSKTRAGTTHPELRRNWARCPCGSVAHNTDRVHSSRAYATIEQ